MKELYVIRHGIAEPRTAENLDDEHRQLTKKGKEKVKDITKSLKNMGISFDIIFTSPLDRASQTAELMEGLCNKKDGIIVSEILKPGGTYNELIDQLNSIDGADSIAIVGHEPFLSGFISYCLSKSRSSFIVMKKGGIAALAVNGEILPGKCELMWLMGPGQLLNGM
jgi:phosphohistidine phosphatase SixA